MRQKDMDAFELPVHYRGEELQFPAELKQTGYSHQIVVDVYGTDVFFEPDEERNYRALVDPEKLTKQVNAELLKAIAESIEAIVK
ncbi:MAG TPA: hypothetical protein VFL47_17390 [Flavisolibacter sp.]|nr:hypothetical protein [Flavisolibacter sp.]